MFLVLGVPSHKKKKHRKSKKRGGKLLKKEKREEEEKKKGEEKKKEESKEEKEEKGELTLPVRPSLSPVNIDIQADALKAWKKGVCDLFIVFVFCAEVFFLFVVRCFFFLW